MLLQSRMSKDFDRLLDKKIETFMSKKLSTKLSGFRKNCNTQYCLIAQLTCLKKRNIHSKKVNMLASSSLISQKPLTQ